MVLPGEPITLSADEVVELNRKLAKMRHDINNNLAVLVAAMDLVRYKPDALEKWLSSITEQPVKISDSIRAFSAEFEKTLQIKPGSSGASNQHPFGS